MSAKMYLLAGAAGLAALVGVTTPAAAQNPGYPYGYGNSNPVGGILGQVLGKDTDSTLKGAAAGAAVGTGVAAVTGDLDFTIEPGRTVAFTLEEPLQVR